MSNVSREPFDGSSDDRLKREPVWLVWNPRGHAPVRQHRNVESATAEAQRLARLNPGQDFFVLAQVSGWTVLEPPVARLDIDPEYIPF